MYITPPIPSTAPATYRGRIASAGAAMVKEGCFRLLGSGPLAADVDDVAAPSRHGKPPAHDWSDVWVDRRHTEVLTTGAGAPVIFFHGWGLSPRSYLPALRAAAAHDRQLIAPSLPGFGGSAPLPLRRQNLSGIADHMAAVLEELGHTGGVDVVGHSFGGGVALELGASRPDLVRSLTLVCPVGGAGNGAVPLARMAMGAVMDARHRRVHRVMTDFGSALIRHPSSVATAGFAAWRADLMSRLARVHQHGVPARLIFADADQVVSPGDMATCTYDGITVEVTAGGHAWPISDPQRFASSVVKVLAAAGDSAAVA